MVLSCTPGCQGSFEGILQRELKLGCSWGPASPCGGACRSPKKAVTCLNFGIRQEEDGFVSSATPFQLFPERQRLEDVAALDYNIGEPAPAALPSFVPAAGIVLLGFRSSGGISSVGWSGSPSPCAVGGPAQHLGQDGGLCPRQGFPRLGTGRGSCCRTAVWERWRDGEQERQAAPRALLGTGSRAVLSLGASAAPICRRRSKINCGILLHVAGAGMSAGSFPPSGLSRWSSVPRLRQRPRAASRKVSCCRPRCSAAGS